MTEPENFDDDLFADLYNDDEPTGRPAAAPASAPASQPAPTASVTEQHSVAPTTEPMGQDMSENNEYMGDQYGDGDASARDEYEEEEDEVDFNLGNGSTATAQHAETPTHSTPTPAPSGRGPNSKEDGKMFIGGLNWETTDQSLRDYFSQFGEVLECTVMRDGATGRSRGFGFLTFKDPKTVNIVMVKEHHLDGKIIDPKRAIPRDEQEKTSKIFVGGVSQETTDQEFRDYFAQFGRVVDATLMMDKDTGRPRGFGFVTFESEAGVDACLSANLEIHGKPIEVKKAQPRGNMREEEDSGRRGGMGRFRRGQSAGMDDQGSATQQMGAPGGMTPQLMAQYWQRMQQYFAMMQQQMAMNRGMGGMGGMNGMNPAMVQMMQMQQMQQMMGRGGPGANPMAAMANMNPQMMQQMQQMMAQQGGPGMAPGGAGAGAGNGGGGGGPNQARGFSPGEQQMFEQKYDQQPGRRGRDNQQYGQGGGYGMGGGPTSWEGMYDDVPQPNIGGGGGGGGGGGRGGFHRSRGGHHQQQQQIQMPQSMDPTNAPPANAPTGPKNAGKPGANYRGGGRGGNRGYHPYARG